MTDSPQFFQTQMGRQYFDSTMPRLVEQLSRLNDLLERLLATQEAQGKDPDPEPQDKP